MKIKKICFLDLLWSKSYQGKLAKPFLIQKRKIIHNWQRFQWKKIGNYVIKNQRYETLLQWIHGLILDLIHSHTYARANPIPRHTKKLLKGHNQFAKKSRKLWNWFHTCSAFPRLKRIQSSCLSYQEAFAIKNQS